MAIIVSRIRCGWLFILCVGAALFYLQPFAFSSFSMQTDWSGDRVMMCDPHCGNWVPAFLFSTTKCELNHIVQKVLDDPYDRNIICGQKSDRNGWYFFRNGQYDLRLFRFSWKLFEKLFPFTFVPVSTGSFFGLAGLQLSSTCSSTFRSLSCSPGIFPQVGCLGWFGSA